MSLHGFRICTIGTVFGYPLLLVVCVLTMSLADEADWLTVIHTNDIQSHFDESGASPKACRRGAYCFGGVPRLVKMVREARAKHQNVLVLDAGGLLNTALLDNPSGHKLITDLVSLVGYDAMSMGVPEVLGGVDALVRYIGLTGAPFVCTNIVIQPANGSGAAQPPCQQSLLLSAGRLKVGVVSYLDPDLAELKFISFPKVTLPPAMPLLKEETADLRRRGALLVIALAFTRHGISTITREVPEVDLVVLGHINSIFYNGLPPHGEYVFAPYPDIRNRSGRAPLLIVGAHAMLHYAGQIQLRAAQHGGVSGWRATNPLLLSGSKDGEAEAVMARLRASQDAFLGGLVARSSYFLDGGQGCRKHECALGSLAADAMLEEVIEPVYRGNDVIEWSRVGAALFNGAAIRASIAPGLIREEDLRIAMPFSNHLVVVTVRGDRLQTMLKRAASNTRHGLQVSGLHMSFLTTLDRSGTRMVGNPTIICTVCQMPAYKSFNLRHAYRVVTTEYYVSELGAGIDEAVTMNVTMRDATRALMRKMSPLAQAVEDRIVVTEVVKMPTSGAGPALGDPLHAAGALLVLVLEVCRGQWEVLLR